LERSVLYRIGASDTRMFSHFSAFFELYNICILLHLSKHYFEIYNICILLHLSKHYLCKILNNLSLIEVNFDTSRNQNPTETRSFFGAQAIRCN